jgi:toxic protein SymE
MKKTRILKVYKKAQQRQRYYAIVPEIRLQGEWLQKIGFGIGSTVQVRIASQKIVLELVEKNEAAS